MEFPPYEGKSRWDGVGIKILVEIMGLRKDLKGDRGDINDDYWQ